MFDLSSAALLVGILAVFIIVARKIPALRAISMETLENRETFLNCLKRKAGEFPDLVFKIPVWLIKILEKSLLKIKILSLKMYNRSHNLQESLRGHKESGKNGINKDSG